VLDSPYAVGDAQLDGLDSQSPLSERALSKLRWRTRRGLLENDLFIERFFARHGSHLTVAHARSMYVLMDLADNDLLDLFLKRKTLPPEMATPEVCEVLNMLLASGSANS
jgi:antitoxin CptB